MQNSIVEARLRPLEIFTRQDIANILAALYLSETRHDDYFVALRRVATAFGIDVYEAPSESAWHIGGKAHPLLVIENDKG